MPSVSSESTRLSCSLRLGVGRTLLRLARFDIMLTGPVLSSIKRCDKKVVLQLWVETFRWGRGIFLKSSPRDMERGAESERLVEAQVF